MNSSRSYVWKDKESPEAKERFLGFVRCFGMKEGIGSSSEHAYEALKRGGSVSIAPWLVLTSVADIDFGTRVCVEYRGLGTSVDAIFQSAGEVFGRELGGKNKKLTGSAF